VGQGSGWRSAEQDAGESTARYERNSARGRTEEPASVQGCRSHGHALAVRRLMIGGHGRGIPVGIQGFAP